MNEITVRPMTPEDWPAVSKIYLEGIATEHATFQTDCPPYPAWDASHIKECRLVVEDDGVLAGWTALHRVDPRWCYRGVAEVSIYIGERFRGRGLGYHLLTTLCQQADRRGISNSKAKLFNAKKAMARNGHRFFCIFYFDCLRNYQNQYRFLTATYAMRQATTRMPAPMKKVQLMLVKRRFWLVSRYSPATSACATPSL